MSNFTSALLLHLIVLQFFYVEDRRKEAILFLAFDENGKERETVGGPLSISFTHTYEFIVHFLTHPTNITSAQFRNFLSFLCPVCRRKIVIAQVNCTTKDNIITHFLYSLHLSCTSTQC